MTTLQERCDMASAILNKLTTWRLEENGSFKSGVKWFQYTEKPVQEVRAISLRCLVKETLERTGSSSRDICVLYQSGQEDVAEELKYYLEVQRKKTRLFEVRNESYGVGIDYLPKVEGDFYYLCLPHLNVVPNIFPQRVFSQLRPFSPGLL